jgi:hypothetical protein
VSGRILGRKEAIERFPALDARVWNAATPSFRCGSRAAGPTGSSTPAIPLARQVFPDARELEVRDEDVEDPVGDRKKRPVPWVVQKHADRALLLVTRRCHLHCRYCFRRDQSGDDPTAEELDRAIAWVERAGLEEVILSGGDPLTLSDERPGRDPRPAARDPGAPDPHARADHGARARNRAPGRPVGGTTPCLDRAALEPRKRDRRRRDRRASVVSVTPGCRSSTSPCSSAA